VGIDADGHSSMYDPFVFQEIRSAELRTEIAQVLHGYKQMLAGSWDQYLAALDIQLREKLVKKYGL
jgi:transportin-1